MPERRLLRFPYPTGRLTAAVTVGAVAAALAGAVLPAVVSGDMTYALVWGQELVDGQLRSFAPGPTPHPLTIAFGALVSPLGVGGAYVATQVVFGFLAFGLLVGAAFEIAWRLLAGRGAAAALLLVTSTPLLIWTAQPVMTSCSRRSCSPRSPSRSRGPVGGGCRCLCSS